MDKYFRKKKCGYKKVYHFPDVEEHLENVEEFVFLLCDLPTCFDNQNKCFRACNCLRRLTIDSRVLLVKNLIPKLYLRRYFYEQQQPLRMRMQMGLA